ncbi:diphthine synthase [Candidatus Methanomethylophilus sp. 1R26]|uniref:diphthine synthase n=1 Tax=Candidatus Methanomethylophilus sp. 1R26 TaxID=1769296 RepID=UPI001F48B1D3|nr:diphthine synthase [Candidatus Methanomethylophilus sp. 1R26]
MTPELDFVGLGLSGVDGMTVKAFNALKECDRIFAEFYTSNLIGASAEDLEKALGKKIEIVYRSEVEEGHRIIDSAKECRTAFVTAGDTMLATTHVDLMIQAKYENIPVKVFNGVSIFSACPTCFGLQPTSSGGRSPCRSSRRVAAQVPLRPHHGEQEARSPHHDPPGHPRRGAALHDRQGRHRVAPGRGGEVG